MFRAKKVLPHYLNLLGWRQHYDSSEISLSNTLTETLSGEYYQSKHPALELNTIKALMPPNREIGEYLKTTIEDSTTEMLNDLLQYRNLNEHGKTLLERAVLLNRYGWAGAKEVNQGRFVGLQIRVRETMGLKAVIEEVGLQLSLPDNVNLYLFHSSKVEPIATIEMGANDGKTWNWKTEQIDLLAFDVEQSGGVYVLGYYQDHLTAQAINQKDFNFENGYCSTCNPSHGRVWKSITNLYTIVPLYAPAGNFVEGEMLDLDKVNYTINKTWGLNLKLSAQCDYTEFFITNAMMFKNLLALKVTYNVLKMMQYSNQINHVEEDILNMVIRDLEGDKETNATNIPNQYKRELKSVTFNMSGLNNLCHKSNRSGYAPRYGVI